MAFYIIRHMKPIALTLALFLIPIATQQLYAQDESDETATEEEIKQIPLPEPTDEEPLPLPDEEYFEEETPPAMEPAFEGTDREASSRRKLTIDAVVVVNYTFVNVAENYSVKYHINMGGTINSDVGMIKGNAKIATDISGFLAKSSAFECLLKVSIADVPYEIMFKKTDEKEATINVVFKDQILEDWESLCTFLDTSGAKFNTRGAPERWIGVALEKANPPLTKLTAPLDPQKLTTLKFSISKHNIPDEGLGSAEVDGTGVVTIEPEILKANQLVPELIE